MEEFKEAAAKYNGVEPENIVPASGGDGVLRLILMTLVDPGEKAVINYPSYSMYSIYARVIGLRLSRVQLKEENDHWVPDIGLLKREMADSSIAMIDDPNNPSGSSILGGKADLVRDLLESTPGLVVMDEAYYEFSGYSVANLVEDFPNLIVLRTMSKAFSMASFRVGYAIMNSNLARMVSKATTPFDVAGPSLRAGIAALRNPGYAHMNALEISKNREWLKSKLRQLGFRVYNSETNFLLIKSEKDLTKQLLQKKIVVRTPMEGYYRVTVGTREQCQAVIDALGQVE